ncbi:MAG: DUF6788 family protein [Anaerolineae bacterium]
MPPRTSLSAHERRLYSKLRQLLYQPGLLRGSLVQMHRRCGKRSCGCHHDPARRHRSLYLGLRLDGKQRMIYIPPNWEERVRQWTARYGQVREVLELLSRQCLKRLQRRQE